MKNKIKEKIFNYLIELGETVIPDKENKSVFILNGAMKISKKTVNGELSFTVEDVFGDIYHDIDNMFILVLLENYFKSLTNKHKKIKFIEKYPGLSPLNYKVAIKTLNEKYR